jgi:hypothetical protein
MQASLRLNRGRPTPVLSPTPVLDGLSLGRRALAFGAVALGNLIAATAPERRGGDGAILVAYANLGDQLRMMNVWSRFADEQGSIAVACNTPTAEAFSLFSCVGAVRAFSHQGAQSLGESLRRWRRRSAQYAISWVPHPFFTRPIALAYARTHAAGVIAIEGRGASIGTTVPLDASSWRAAYERLAARCFPDVTPAARPRPSLRVTPGSRSAKAVLHVTSSEQSRALGSDDCKTIARELLRLGLQLTVVGASREENMLRSTFAGVDNVSFLCGATLRMVAEIFCDAALFVGVDSSMMQLADAVGLPSVVIYKSTSAKVTGPYYTRFIAIEPEGNFHPVGVVAESSWKQAPSSWKIDPASVSGAAAQLLEERA